MPKRDEILAQLLALVREQSKESRLEVSRGPVYVLASATGRKRRVRCQAVSSVFLPGERKLSSHQGMALRKLGYAKGGETRNWVKEIPADEGRLEDLADEIIDVLGDIYGAEPEQLLTRLVHDDTEHPENPDLLTAMAELAGDNANQDKRHRLYNALLNATFLVPLDPEADEAADAGEEFLVSDRFDDKPVFIAFTDWASLQMWNPRTCPYLPVHGSDLFQLTLDLSLSLLEINPGGNTGGQLYAHEVETLADAVRDWKRRNLH